MKYFHSAICGLAVLAIIACRTRTHNDASGTSSVLAEHQFHEYPYKGEEEWTKKAIELALANIAKARQRDGGITRRDAHPKAHGCVKGDFTVDALVPEKGRAGIFAAQKTYPVWIRFSNAATVGADRTLDARGIAVKLMNVPGKKILDEEANAETQDFLLVNDPVFPTRNIEQYVKLQENTPLFLATHPREALLATRAFSRKIETPLESNYWSMSAYRLGDEVVKYKVVPCHNTNYVWKDKKEENYLRLAMADQLSKGAGCFNLYAQFFKDEKKTPVEDPSVEWDESDAAPVKMATITIPKQTFDTNEQNTFCEHLSFTPWHSLPEHRPLGNLNRARLEVYKAISKRRHSDNGAPRTEPKPTN